MGAATTVVVYVGFLLDFWEWTILMDYDDVSGGGCLKWVIEKMYMRILIYLHCSCGELLTF